MWLVGLVVGAIIGAIGGFEGAVVGGVAGLVAGLLFSLSRKGREDKWKSDLEGALRNLQHRVEVLEGRTGPVMATETQAVAEPPAPEFAAEPVAAARWEGEPTGVTPEAEPAPVPTIT